jgi:hypothetical protein
MVFTCATFVGKEVQIQMGHTSVQNANLVPEIHNNIVGRNQ